MSIFDKLLKSPQSQSPQPKNTITVKQQDGTTKEYQETFMIMDKSTCFVCMGKYYHTYLGCDSLKWEQQQDSELKEMPIKEAKAQKMIYCQKCSRADYLFRHDRMDEI